MFSTMFCEVSIDICRFTGFADVLFNGKKTGFRSKQDAVFFIEKKKKEQILETFNKYVNHKRILQETGHRAFYQTISRCDSLDKCIRMKDVLPGYKLQGVLKVILSLEKDLHNILPAPKNPSYEPERGKLIEMMVFCKSEIKNQN